MTEETKGHPQLITHNSKKHLKCQCVYSLNIEMTNNLKIMIKVQIPNCIAGLPFLDITNVKQLNYKPISTTTKHRN